MDMHKIGTVIPTISLPSMVMLGCQASSASFTLMKAVKHQDALMVNLALSDQAITLFTSVGKETMITSLLRAMRAIARESA